MSIPARCWAPWFSPYATFGAVSLSAVRQALRQQWRRWGLPHTLRVDNGVPWGNGNDLPTPFALWVLGLGITWHGNDPCCPQQNPKIERSQGTGKRWAEPGRCQSVAELQAHLDEADGIQRAEYPTRGGRSRMELFPELCHSGRKYSQSWEEQTWSLRRVEAQLAEYIAIRKVSATGQVKVYDRSRYIGKPYVGQYVQMHYDPERHQWIVADQEGREIRHLDAPEINHEEIVKCIFRKKRPEP
jgi:hypothetical protein